MFELYKSEDLNQEQVEHLMSIGARLSLTKPVAYLTSVTCRGFTPELFKDAPRRVFTNKELLAFLDKNKDWESEPETQAV